MTHDAPRQTWFFTSFEVAMRIAMPILLGVSAWAFTNILDHEKRLTVIESTQPTRDDLKEINNKLNTLAEVSAVRGMQMESMAETLAKIREYIIANESGERRLP